MNKTILVGRLCKEHYINDEGKTVICKNTVAINKGKDKEADFIPITAFGKTAEFMMGYFKKGDVIVIEGRTDIRQVNNGTPKKPVYETYASVIAEHISFA